MSEEEKKDVINYVESICNGTYSTEEEGFEIKKYINQLQQENKELKERIESLKELDLYTCEADYDYEENLELNYVPFSMEEFLEGGK